MNKLQLLAFAMISIMPPKERKLVDPSRCFHLASDVQALKADAVGTLRRVLVDEVQLEWDGKSPLSATLVEALYKNEFNERAMCEMELLDSLTAAPLKILRYAEAFPNHLPLKTVEDAKAKLASVFERFMPRKPVDEVEEAIA